MSADGAITCEFAACRGMPQGPPLVNAALIEDIIIQTEAEIMVVQRAAGVRLHQSATGCHSLFRCTHGRTSYLLCVDDTSALGATPQATSYAIGRFARSFAQAQQILHPGKCEVLEPEGATADVAIFGEDALSAYQKFQPACQRGTSSSTSFVAACAGIACVPGRWPRSSSVTSHRFWVVCVAESEVAVVSARCASAPSMQIASSHGGRMCDVGVGVHPQDRSGPTTPGRCAASDASAHCPDRPQTDRALARLPPPAREREVSFLVRRSFACSTITAIQEFSVVGHVARLSEDHVVTEAFFWRDQAWWEGYRSSFMFRTGGQLGRRPARGGPICRTEAFLVKGYAAAKRSEKWDDCSAHWQTETLTDRVPSTWRELAQGREVFRDFCRRAVFAPEM